MHRSEPHVTGAQKDSTKAISEERMVWHFLEPMMDVKNQIQAAL